MHQKPWLLLFALGTLAVVPHLHAQSASAVFNGPQNMDAGLQNGLNNLTGYVTFLPSDIKMLEARRFCPPARCLRARAKTTSFSVWP